MDTDLFDFTLRAIVSLLDFSAMHEREAVATLHEQFCRCRNLRMTTVTVALDRQFKEFVVVTSTPDNQITRKVKYA